MRWLAALLLAGVALLPPPARAIDYRIDPARSQAQFVVRLFWLRSIQGRFTRMDGEVAVSPQGMAVVDARIQVESLAANGAWIRRWMLAEEFFDGPHYPIVHFVSAPVPLAAIADGEALDGTLTLRGVTRPVRFELDPAPCIETGERPCTIVARGRVTRSDFGMTARRPALADEVRLNLQVVLEAVSVPH
ncbi:YceI family protein [Frateuria defendens]|uniref:YceI family protein n=1 Tax=Frateuria defendens TaxID=2219559 RepID=UPI00066FD932|nr:YceI family protein [Frateuria defendens]